MKLEDIKQYGKIVLNLDGKLLSINYFDLPKPLRVVYRPGAWMLPPVGMFYIYGFASPAVVGSAWPVLAYLVAYKRRHKLKEAKFELWEVEPSKVYMASDKFLHYRTNLKQIKEFWAKAKPTELASAKRLNCHVLREGDHSLYYLLAPKLRLVKPLLEINALDESVEITLL